MTDAERTFPIQVERGAGPHPIRVPWSVAEKAYSVYAAKYGRSQSLEEIGRRGGFGSKEMDLFVPGWREECSQIAALTAEVERLTAGGQCPNDPAACISDTWNAGFKEAEGRYDALLALRDAEVERLTARVQAEHSEAEHYRVEASTAFLREEQMQEQLARRDAALAEMAVAVRGAIVMLHELGEHDEPVEDCTYRVCYDLRQAFLSHPDLARAQAVAAVVEAAERRYEVRYLSPDSPEAYVADQAIFAAVARRKEEKV